MLWNIYVCIYVASGYIWIGKWIMEHYGENIIMYIYMYHVIGIYIYIYISMLWYVHVYIYVSCK